MLVVGLTGGIASGKTTVAALLHEHGAAVIDADLVGHEVYRPHLPAWRSLIEAFGSEVLAVDQTIDRRRLGALVFGNAAQMRRLTDIVWPEMKQLMRERLEELRTGGERVVVLEAAVLIEAGWQDIVAEVWATVVQPDVAVARLIARNGLTEEQARARLATQISNEERTKQADIVIDNSGTVAELSQRVGILWQELCERAA